MTHMISSMQLWIYPTIALVLFLLVFIAVIIRVFQPGRRLELDHAASIPFEDTILPVPTSSTQGPAPDARSTNP